MLDIRKIHNVSLLFLFRKAFCEILCQLQKLQHRLTAEFHLLKNFFRITIKIPFFHFLKDFFHQIPVFFCLLPQPIGHSIVFLSGQYCKFVILQKAAAPIKISVPADLLQMFQQHFVRPKGILIHIGAVYLLQKFQTLLQIKFCLFQRKLHIPPEFFHPPAVQEFFLCFHQIRFFTGFQPLLRPWITHGKII